MSNIRNRLTTAYVLALAGTLIAFGIVLWLLSRVNAREQQERELAVLAEGVVQQIVAARPVGDSLTMVIDSVSGIAVATNRLRSRLEGVPGYLWVLAPNGRALYTSWAVRQLPPEARSVLQRRVLDIVQSQPIEGPDERVILRPGEMGLGEDSVAALGEPLDLRLTQRSHPDFPSQISRVVVGLPTRVSVFPPREVIGAALMIAPLIVLFAAGAAYMIAGPAIRSNLDRIINEVEAITDGRSLHRRLPVDATADELARLTATLNAMMGRLETSFAALRRFTADASHELKTPLAVLRANVERAMSTPPGSTDQMIALEEALQEVARMTDLVDSLLTLARADEGRFDLHREPVAMEPLAHEVLETAVILGEQAGLAIEMPIIEPAVVMGDRTRLRQLFLNLVTNAIKYTPRGGDVTLSLVRRDGAVAFTVRDTGIGIAAADLPHVFERFYRADRVRSRLAERGGFGLGLSISQWIVQAHGGHLSVSSRLGRGSTFTVTLPIQQDAGAGAAEMAAAVAQGEPA